MQFIEIKDGLSIAVDKIEAIEEVDNLGCRVYTSTGVAYESAFPKNVLLSIIEHGGLNKEDRILEQVTKIADNNQYYRT